MIIRRGTIKKTGERIVHHNSSEAGFNQSFLVWVYTVETNESKSLFRNAITWDQQEG